MPIIPWINNFSVNVKELDEQHKVFIELLNSLYEIMLKPESSQEIRDILHQLITYTTFHFATEERYFDKFNYEFAIEHKNEHRKLLLEVAEFNKRLDSEGDRVMTELLNFLGDWLANHLDTQDKEYTKCFNEHGLF